MSITTKNTSSSSSSTKDTSTKEICIICAENMTTSKKVKCEYCDFVACKQCCRTYICDRVTPTCMSSDCKKKWTDEFMNTHLNKSFMSTTYKKVIENILYDQEKTLLPETQEALKKQKFIEESTSLSKTLELERDSLKPKLKEAKQDSKFALKKLNSSLYSLHKKLDNIENHPKLDEKTLQDKIIEKEQQIDIESRQIRCYAVQMEEISKKLDNLQRDRIKYLNNNNGNDKKEKKQFIKRCSKELCRGYLSTSYKCGICESWHCPSCHELKTQQEDVHHVCNPETLATIEALKKETRNCPNIACGHPIYKIDGCDQMWCTSCHTAFSWKTGEIETKIHNPHYFQYMRETKQVIPRLGCIDNPEINGDQIAILMDMLDEFMINENTEIFMIGGNEVTSFILNLFRDITHIKEYTMPKYKEPDHWRKNFDIRCLYLNNEITEDRFKELIQRRHKKNNVKKEIFNILDMVYKTINDILLRFNNDFYTTYVQKNQVTVDFAIFNELGPLQVYANTCLKNISDIYSTKCLQFRTVNNLLWRLQ
jgi:hypothetical protein